MDPEERREKNWKTIKTVISYLMALVCLGLLIGVYNGDLAKEGGNGTKGGDGAECFYFIFTTLSTVGYGDMSPTTKWGRSLCGFVMLWMWLEPLLPWPY